MVDVNNRDQPIEIAPGIQWQATAELDQPTQVDLPYRFHTWNIQRPDQRSTRDMASFTRRPYPTPPFNHAERTALQHTLLAMGYQAITTQLTLCPDVSASHTDACTKLPLDDSQQLHNLIASYRSLQLTLDDI